jgi:hypothetical protein
MSTQTIKLQIICVNPPSEHFGLQRKNRDIVAGEKISNTALAFPFELKVKQTDDGQPNFTGDFAHGSVKERFVYLTTKTQQSDGEWRIRQRIKVHLKTITWEQVEAVLDNREKFLSAKVDGRGTASVPLLDDGWIVKSSEDK